MVHHEEAGHVHTVLASPADVLGGHVRLGAVRCDANAAHTELMSPLEILDRPDAGKQQGREDGVPCGVRGRLDPGPVAVTAEAVGRAAAGQPVAVRDLDRGDARGVQGRDDVLDLVDGVLVPHRVHPVAQRDVLHVDLMSHGFRVLRRRCVHARPRETSSSAVRSAAEVMMSRFPAYSGR